VNAAIIFGLLIALMLTGMPISIALGLSVLTFLFTMTDDRGRGPEALHRHRELRDHGNPVFHPRRQFSYSRGGREADDRFRSAIGTAVSALPA